MNTPTSLRSDVEQLVKDNTSFSGRALAAKHGVSTIEVVRILFEVKGGALPSHLELDLIEWLNNPDHDFNIDGGPSN